MRFSTLAVLFCVFLYAGLAVVNFYLGNKIAGGVITVVAIFCFVMVLTRKEVKDE